MSQSNDQLIIKTATKLGLVDERNILSKTQELLRLLQTKYNITQNDQQKIVICMDIAASQFGTHFDKEKFLKLCGLGSKTYQNFKRTIEKVLDIDNQLTIHDVCRRLQLQLEIENYAKKLYSNYKKWITDKVPDEQRIDLTHPQYIVMSVYQAAKSMKVKCLKNDFIKLSTLKTVQWNQLEENWQQWLKQADLRTNPGAEKSDQHDKENGKSMRRSIKNKDIEDYEVWKERMLAKAYAQLK